MGQIVSEILFYQYKWLKKEDFLYKILLTKQK